MCDAHFASDLRQDVSERRAGQAGRAAQPQPGGAGPGLAGGHRAGPAARQLRLRLLPARQRPLRLHRRHRPPVIIFILASCPYSSPWHNEPENKTTPPPKYSVSRSPRIPPRRCPE